MLELKLGISGGVSEGVKIDLPERMIARACTGLVFTCSPRKAMACALVWTKTAATRQNELARKIRVPRRRFRVVCFDGDMRAEDIISSIHGGIWKRSPRELRRHARETGVMRHPD